MTQFDGPLTNRVPIGGGATAARTTDRGYVHSLGEADDTGGGKVVRERLLAWRTAEAGCLDGALVSLRTKPRLISAMRLHIKDRDCARRPRQVRRFAWR